MAADAVTWLRGLFADLSVRAPHGISWDTDRDDAPLTVRCGLADGPTAEILLSDGVRSRIAVAEQLQRLVDAAWEVAVPPCPAHGGALRPSRSGDEVRWRCPAGDVDCPVGGYEELLWPPGPDDDANVLLAHRCRRFGVTGLNGFSIDAGVVEATVRDGFDEAALRAAAAPLEVRITLRHARWVAADRVAGGRPGGG